MAPVFNSTPEFKLFSVDVSSTLELWWTWAVIVTVVLSGVTSLLPVGSVTDAAGWSNFSLSLK